MLVHNWIMLSTILLTYLAATVLCPRNCWAGPVQHRPTSDLQPHRISVVQDGVSYSLQDNQNSVDNRFVECGCYIHVRRKYDRPHRRKNKRRHKKKNKRRHKKKLELQQLQKYDPRQSGNLKRDNRPQTQNYEPQNLQPDDPNLSRKATHRLKAHLEDTAKVLRRKSHNHIHWHMFKQMDFNEDKYISWAEFETYLMYIGIEDRKRKRKWRRERRKKRRPPK